ncbi:MAG: DNA repair protein [Erysipelotrichaceae bacterium]|nr:DNA repair protein [Erysipelotrichaceae bacterium]
MGMYLCVDLKSFYASVECVERGLDPMKTNLAVADPSRGKGAICLAISPALKALGVKNRCRLFAIPDNIEYITAMPRMKKYMEYSQMIYKVYLRYFSKDDIYIYSIDECFIDIESYMTLYSKNHIEIAKMVIADVLKSTGITATCGIGTNLFLAKVALDIEAKKAKDFIGYLDEEKFKRTIWFHTPITDIWNIGPGIASRLEKYNAYSLYAVSNLDEKILYDEFGVNAEYLIDHANGVEKCTLKEIKEYVPENNSLSNSQILFEDYEYEDAYLVFREMIEMNVLNLVAKGLVTSNIFLSVGYSKDCIRPTGGSMKLGEFTNSYRKLSEYFKRLFEKTTDKNHLIRRLSIGFGNVVDEKNKTVDLFTDEELEKKEHNLQQSIIKIKNKHGKNSVIKAMNIEKNATQIKRNKLVGGHNAE